MPDMGAAAAAELRDDDPPATADGIADGTAPRDLAHLDASALALALDGHDAARRVELLLAAIAIREAESLHAALVEAYVELGRWGRASLHAIRVVELGRRGAVGWLRVARMAIHGQAERVVDMCLDPLLRDHGLTATDAHDLCARVVDAALDCARQREWDRLARWIPLVDRLVAKVPEDPAAASLRCLLAWRAGDRGAAGAWARRAGTHAATPEDVARWSDHLRYHHAFEPAATLLEAACVRWPDDPPLRLRLGCTLAELGRLAKAVPLWQRVPESHALATDARFLATVGRCRLEGRGPSDDELAALQLPSPAAYTIDAARLEPDRLAEILSRHGIAVVRGGVARLDCERMLARFEHNLRHAFFSEASGADASAANVPSARDDEVNVPLQFFAEPGLTRRLAAAFAPIRDQPIAMWHWGLDEAIESDEIRDLVLGNAALVQGLALRLGGPLTVDRSLGYGRAKRAGQRCVLPFHQDARTGYWEHPTIAVWTALTPCGEHAPGLEVVPLRLRSFFPVCLYGGADRPDYQYYPASAWDDLIPPWATVAPRLDPGDMLLFDTYVLHRTQRLTGETGRRVDFDLRATLATPWVAPRY